jgi:GT2 family glycosyltransferase
MMPTLPQGSGRVDVVVVTAGGVERTVMCLARISGADVARRIVVENAGPKETADELARASPDAEVVVLEVDKGLSAAYNRGAERGAADLILFLNDDVFALDDAVERLVAALDDRPEAVAAAGLLVGSDLAPQETYAPRSFPDLRDFVFLFTGLEQVRQRRSSAVLARHPDEVRQIEHAAGACLLVRRSAFETVGGWDERFSYWYEDVDLSRRLARHGQILYVPAARFEHIGGATTRRLDDASVLVRLTHGALHYAQSHFTRTEQITLAFVLWSVAASRLALARARGHRDVARALRLVLRNAGALARGRSLQAPPL